MVEVPCQAKVFRAKCSSPSRKSVTFAQILSDLGSKTGKTIKRFITFAQQIFPQQNFAQQSFARLSFT